MREVLVNGADVLRYARFCFLDYKIHFSKTASKFHHGYTINKKNTLFAGGASKWFMQDSGINLSCTKSQTVCYSISV
jgi:hypothetical protein